MNAVIDQATWAGRATRVPAEYATTDRVCQRWAVSVGMGLPTEIWMDGIASRPPPLDDDTAIVVDQIILKSPPRTKRLVVGWYRTPVPQSVLAQNCGLTTKTLVTGWYLSLNYLRWRFGESKHGPLLAALKLRG
jgi:hypothetical protein